MELTQIDSSNNNVGLNTEMDDELNEEESLISRSGEQAVPQAQSQPKDDISQDEQYLLDILK